MEPVEHGGPHLTRRDAIDQTGSTGVIAKLIQIRGLLDAETLLKHGKSDLSAYRANANFVLRR